MTLLGAQTLVSGRIRPPDDWSPSMLDLWFVLLTIAFFAVVGLVVRGVERL